MAQVYPLWMSVLQTMQYLLSGVLNILGSCAIYFEVLFELYNIGFTLLLSAVCLAYTGLVRMIQKYDPIAFTSHSFGKIIFSRWTFYCYFKNYFKNYSD